MNLKSDSVAGGMRECIGHSRFAEDAARGLVHFAATDACSYGRNAAFLGLQHCFVGVSFFCLWLSEADGTRHVGAVALPDYTEVEG